MSLAYSAPQPDLETPAIVLPPLCERVRSAISLHTEFSTDRILTQENREKYAEKASGSGSSDHLFEVFDLMRQLNEQGLASNSLGKATNSGNSFRQALLEICSQIAQTASARPLTYVELGPEPIKTAYILKTLQEMNVKIDQYIAVDINPKSAEHMRPVLEQVLNGTPLTFVTSAFEEFQMPELQIGSETPALITMLGFQEGNDDPSVVNEWLRTIARPGDYLLAESQLLIQSHQDRISSFYSHPAMLRFSRIAFEKAICTKTPSLNRFFLLPVQFHDGQTAQAAILAEEYATTTRQRNLHVSNFCLKLTPEQYRHYRALNGHFKILCEATSGDETLHFQLSRRN